MFSGLLNAVGLAQNANTGLYNYANSAQQAQQQYNQALMNSMLAQQRTEWMINGRAMTFAQFVEEICPDPDDPMRTFLILKYKDTK
jgi:hypothetical protein